MRARPVSSSSSYESSSIQPSSWHEGKCCMLPAIGAEEIGRET
jgi:hypothetical protein